MKKQFSIDQCKSRLDEKYIMSWSQYDDTKKINEHFESLQVVSQINNFNRKNINIKLVWENELKK